MTWTLDDLPDLSGKVIVVTGASSGIGYFSTLHFARKGAKVVLAVRNVEKGEKVKREIQEKLADDKDAGDLEVMEVDMSKMQSVRAFASTFTRDHNRLDVLLNNAGVMMVEYGLTEDGFETHYATNYLGPFMMTSLLMKLLEKTKGSRIVNVSSIAHKQAQDIDMEMMSGKKSEDNYQKVKVYAQTKLANLLFTFELSRRLKEAKKDVLVVAAHPGWSRTGLQVHGRQMWWFNMFDFVFKPFLSQDSEHGAFPLLMAATDPSAEPGDYYGPNGPMEMKGQPKKVTATNHAKNEGKGKKLWESTEKLLNMKFTI